ncbi:MAG TPA: HNH endonuclease, partial [Lacipirellulaceae bacterium]|nr:HNH endonuclease [Lacipirellulaceae bacterium]
ALLMFPKSTRDEGQLPGGQPTIFEERYLVRRLHIGQLAKRPGNYADVTISTLDLDNGSQRADEVVFADRLASVRGLHSHADRFPQEVRSLIEEHATLCSGNGPIPLRAEQVVAALMSAAAEIVPDYGIEYIDGMDVVEPLVEIAGIQPAELPPDMAQIPNEEVELRLRNAARWRRYAATRGPTAAVFRRKVREAYGSRCIVCGLRWPKNESCGQPGVDSAHILPWATYDCDNVYNGLCLCKLHHWAFDQGLIQIRARAGGGFEVKVTSRAETALAADSDSLAALRAHEGPVPLVRLPDRTADWPKAQLLEKLAEETLGE